MYEANKTLGTSETKGASALLLYTLNSPMSK